MKKTAITILLLLSAFNISAQENYFTFGFKASIGLSKLSGMDRYEEAGIIPGSGIYTAPYSSSVSLAWDYGFVIQHVRNRLMIQGDFTISCMNTKLNGANIEDQDDMKRIRMFYDNISINMGTKFPVNNSFRFVVGVGPYIGFDMYTWFSERLNLYGIDEYSGYNIPDEGILDAEEADYKVFDFGASVLGGIEFNHMQIALNYQHGLVSVVKNDAPIYNRSCKLNLTYFF